jgi:hypothetical protein
MSSPQTRGQWAPHSATDRQRDGISESQRSSGDGRGLIVHGHHHVNYLATAEDGLLVLGVAAAWGATESVDVLWRERPLGIFRRHQQGGGGRG